MNMTKLELIAKRIGEIGDEIKQCKAQRETNLDKCHGSEDHDFQAYWNEGLNDNHDLVNCLMASYAYVKEDTDHLGMHAIRFNEAIYAYGCKNCIGAYEQKRKIGKLKQERGRLIGNISKIGKTL